MRGSNKQPQVAATLSGQIASTTAPAAPLLLSLPLRLPLPPRLSRNRYAVYVVYVVYAVYVVYVVRGADIYIGQSYANNFLTKYFQTLGVSVSS
jgi:hypothetical protein